MPTVYGVPPSPFVRKVRVALMEKGIDYGLEPVSPFDKKPEYLEISPLGKVPAFRDDDGFAFSDSSVICAYLERTRPDSPLYPSDPHEFARVLWLEEYADSKVADVVGTAFFNRVVKTRMMGQESDEEAVKAALGDGLPPLLDYLESQLGESDYFVGGGLTLADIALATQFVNLGHAGEKIDAGRWPKLASWLDRIVARPSFKTCVEGERQMIG